MFRKITLFSVVLALIIILLGSVIRIGDIYPSLIEQNLHQLLKVQIHNYLTVTFGFSVFLLWSLSWWQKNNKITFVITSTIVFILVGVQAALGYWGGFYLSFPIVTTFHVLLGLCTFWLLYGLFLRTTTVESYYVLDKENRNNRLIFTSRLAMLLLGIQIFLGTWLSANHAGLACVGFPQCNGQWIPVADYLNALDFFKGLLNSYNGIISYDAQLAVNWLHRVVAIAVFLLLSLVMFGATAIGSVKSVSRFGYLLGAFLFVLIGIEIVTIKYELPVWMTAVHYLFAAILMLPLLGISFYSRYSQLDTSEIHSKDLVQKEQLTEDVFVSSDSIQEEDYVEPLPESLYSRLKAQLHRTRSGLSGVLSGLQLGQSSINDELLEEIEANLLMADVGIDATNEIIRHLSNNLERHQLKDGEALSKALKAELYRILKPCSEPLQIPKQDEPFVILVVGVNGAGKTTTIGKLAKRLQAQGHSVMLAAGDTFRAAAVEQLQVWGERNNIPVVAQHTGADSASVIYDGLQSAKAKGVDVLIADTAGRLHTKSNLMEELKKIKRIMGKLDSSAPHEVLLVLDAGTGQNALSQAKLFNEAVSLSGLVLTKLDGTAKGGVIFALAKHTGTPIRFIGIGEGIDDLQDFDAELFVDALFVNE